MLAPVTTDLPIHAIRRAFDDAIATGPVVVTSPTGSGKSTEVPRWLAAAGHRVIVVEPRRVACRTLAARVAELEGAALGERVGYAVRDDAVHGDRTRILFATQVSTCPPRFVLFTTGFLDPAYRRFVERRLREDFGFEGSPVQIGVRVRERRKR